MVDGGRVSSLMAKLCAGVSVTPSELTPKYEYVMSPCSNAGEYGVSGVEV